MSKELSLTHGSIVKSIVRFSIPFLLANVLQGLYSNVDVMVVGNFCDKSALSAVSTGGMIMMAVNALIMGLGDGVTVLIGQYFGAGAKEDIKKSIGTAFTVFALIAVFVMAILQLCAKPILDLMRTPEVAREGAMAYTRICYVGVLFTAGYNVTSGVLRGMGDSKRPLIFVAISCTLNIILDVVFVGALHWGAGGAAAATSLAQAISFILSIVYLKRKDDFLFDYKLKSFKPYKDKIRNLMKFGAPIALQNFLASASFLVLLAIINNMGVVESAAAGLSDKIAMFTQMCPIACSATIAAFTAQNVGARQMERAQKGYRITMIAMVVIGTVFAAFMAFMPRQLASIYTNDTDVINVAWEYLVPYAVENILVSYVFCASGFFNGCGHTNISMLAHLISTFAVRIPVAVIWGTRAGATLLSVAIASPISSAVQLAILVIYMLSGKWRKPRSVVGETLSEA